MDEDVYFHKTVTLRTGKQQIEFHTSQELFSSYDVDTGTRFLLRSIEEAGCKPKRILDLGCGYGPLGLTLKKIYPDSIVHMIDRDALAIEYSRQNAALNGLEDIEIYGGLGYDDVKRADFDLIVANIPGKAGETVIAYLLREAQYCLVPGGLVAIVVVASLEPFVVKTLEEIQGGEITLKRNRSGHAVFHYKFNQTEQRKPDLSALERGIYNRQNVIIRSKNLEYTMQTAHGLPEFESLSYESEMMMMAFNKIKGQEIRHAVVFHPGQGHIATALWKTVHTSNIELIDRDLLVLRYSRHNLIRNTCPPERISISHQISLERKNKEKVKLIAGILRDESKAANSWRYQQAAAELAPGGILMITGRSTAIARLTAQIDKEKRLRVKVRERRRGYSLLVLEKVE